MRLPFDKLRVTNEWRDARIKGNNKSRKTRPMPDGGGNCEGVCSNVSVAYHMRWKNASLWQGREMRFLNGFPCV